MRLSLSSDPERKASWQHRRGPVSHVHQEEGPSHRPGHRGAYLSSQGNTNEGLSVSVFINSGSVVDRPVFVLVLHLRSNPKTSLTPGCQSCAITGFIDRTRLCDPPGRPPCEHFLLQLPSSPLNRPQVLCMKPR